MEDDTIQELVTRLSRTTSGGGGSIERAAILAEGSDLAEVEAWILARGGKPELAVKAVASRGLHSSMRGTGSAGDGVPRRYLLPAGWLG
jgi:hypothetical protein